MAGCTQCQGFQNQVLHAPQTITAYIVFASWDELLETIVTAKPPPHDKFRHKHEIRTRRGDLELLDSCREACYSARSMAYPQTGAELLFEVFSQRYERGSTIVTSNLSFDEWTGVFASEL